MDPSPPSTTGSGEVACANLCMRNPNTSEWPHCMWQGGGIVPCRVCWCQINCPKRTMMHVGGFRVLQTLLGRQGLCGRRGRALVKKCAFNPFRTLPCRCDPQICGPMVTRTAAYEQAASIQDAVLKVEKKSVRKPKPECAQCWAALNHSGWLVTTGNTSTTVDQMALS